MKRSKHVLFICEGNLHRSPTAERLYSTTPSIETRSAGLASSARTQVTEEVLAWADLVFVMERRLLRLLQRRFSVELAGKEVVCLEVPDEFQFLQTDLVILLTERLVPYLGQPAPFDEAQFKRPKREK